VVVTSPIPNLPFRGTFHFDEGYYYFSNVGDRVLFGGGRNLNFEAEETDELNTSDQIINHLSSVLEENILPNHAFTIDHHWAGTMGVGNAKNPIVEQLSENLYCAVRLGGMGVAIGRLVGMELADLMIN
jgi:glycine/D-amino acid oxidase-like deaminating enzyme